MSEDTKKEPVTIGNVSAIDKAFATLLELAAPVHATAEQSVAWARLSFRIFETWEKLAPSFKAAEKAQQELFRQFGKVGAGGALSIETTSPNYPAFAAAMTTLEATPVASWPDVEPFTRAEFESARVAPPPITLLRLGRLYRSDSEPTTGEGQNAH